MFRPITVAVSKTSSGVLALDHNNRQMGVPVVCEYSNFKL